jgi:CRP-like cAMP-binding protein
MTAGHGYASNYNPGGRNRFLGSLGSVDLALIIDHLKDQRYEQGVILQEAGEPIDTVYFPQSGMISLRAVMEAGNGIETATIGREGAVGVMAGFGTRRAAGRAVMQIEGTSTRILASHFRAAVSQSPTMREQILRYNDMQMADTYQSVGCNALHTAIARLCRLFLQALDRTESREVPLTQEFLAETLGVQRTTVTLLARDLQEAGFLRYQRGRIEIIDRAGIEARACGCYAVLRRNVDEMFLAPMN